MSETQFPGFCVLYRWRLNEGHEEVFREAWATATRAIREGRGGLGSRLHRMADGTWAAYAQWPDQATWEASAKAGPADPDASELMRAAIAESYDPLLLHTQEDLLIKA